MGINVPDNRGVKFIVKVDTHQSLESRQQNSLNICCFVRRRHTLLFIRRNCGQSMFCGVFYFAMKCRVNWIIRYSKRDKAEFHTAAMMMQRIMYINLQYYTFLTVGFHFVLTHYPFQIGYRPAKMKVFRRYSI